MTELTVQDITEKDIIEKLAKKIELNLETVKQEYMALTVKGIEDKEGYASVHKAYMIIVHARANVEKGRKALKADALEYGRKVDKSAETVKRLLEPIETHLKGQKDIVDLEKKRLEDEAKQKEKEKIQSRLDSFLKVAVNKPFYEVAAMSDSEFELEIAKATEAYFAEQKRLADEEATRKAAEEAARLKAEEEKKEQEALRTKLRAQQEEIDRQKKEAAAAQAKTDAENARIKAEQEAVAKKIEDDRRALELEKQRELDRVENEKKIAADRIETTKKARFEILQNIGYTYPLDDLGIMSDQHWAKTFEAHNEAWNKKQHEAWIAKEKAGREAKAEQEAKEKAEAEVRAKEEEVRKEALRSDREKLLNLLGLIGDIEERPKLKSDAAKEILDAFLSRLENLLIDTQKAVEAL